MHTHLRRFILVLLALNCAGSVPHSWAAPALPETFDLAAIDAFLSAQVGGDGPPGLSVAIVKDGRLVWSKGYGLRSLQPPQPVETNTLFAIASVSKQFTCAAILLLAEDGKLSVHDPVAKYYPGLTRAKEITVLDLMNHTSGYPDYYPLDFVDRRMRQPIDPDDLLRQYAGGPLDFEPASQWSYSNTGYILLGRIVEKVSGEPFGDFLTRRVLKPLGMNHTVYEPALSDDRLAKGYVTFALGPSEPNTPEAAGWVAAAGGLWSTPSDLATWDLALFEGKLLKPDSYTLMTRPRALTDGRLSDYGCGLSVRIQNQRQVLSHSGAVSGFNSWNGMIPSTRCALILTCNQDDGLGNLPGQILGLLLRGSSAVPSVAGSTVAEAVTASFTEYQKGRVDRSRYSEEFNAYLTEERVAGAAKRLKSYGKISRAEVIRTYERGGMEVSVARLHLKNKTLRTLMYRKPDGTIEQFFVYKDP